MAEIDQPEAVSMPLKWVKSNWTILACLAGLGWTGFSNFQALQHDVGALTAKVQSIIEKSTERAQVADEFYRKDASENLPMRVRQLEEETRQLKEALLNFQKGQAEQISAIRDGFSDMKEQIAVVNYKVDDLRAARPQKTNFTK